MKNWAKMDREERIAAIRDGVARGLSSRQIADELEGCSKNAVIGLSDRAGITLVGGRKKDPDRKRERPPQARRTKKPEPISRMGPVSILDIQSGQCRAPMWTDDQPASQRDPGEWLFCGDPVLAGSSYCPECHKRFWFPPQYKPKSQRKSFIAF